jgi:hypothetical protein
MTGEMKVNDIGTQQTAYIGLKLMDFASIKYLRMHNYYKRLVNCPALIVKLTHS